MTKVFITGIAGFLGSHLAEYLLAQGHEVYGCDNLVGGDLANVPLSAGAVVQDCRHLEAMKALLDGCSPDVVYHCAATPHEGLSVWSPAYIFDNIAQASVSVFSAAIAAGVKRIVFCSSMARYGSGNVSFVEGIAGIRKEVCVAPFEEWLEPCPVDPYGVAKVAAEDCLRVLAKLHGVKFQIAVPHNIIGPRQCYTDPYRNVVSIWMNRLKQGKPGVIYGDGSHIRCFSPVQDVTPCLARLGLDDSLLDGEVWNLGPDTGETTILDMYEKVCRATGLTLPPVFELDRPGEVANATCTAAKARSLLGYEDKTGLMECLEEMAAGIPEGGKPFDHDRYPKEIVTDKMPRMWKERLM